MFATPDHAVSSEHRADPGHLIRTLLPTRPPRSEVRASRTAQNPKAWRVQDLKWELVGVLPGDEGMFLLPAAPSPRPLFFF